MVIPNWFNLTPAKPISSSGMALSYSEFTEMSFILFNKVSSSLESFNSSAVLKYSVSKSIKFEWILLYVKIESGTKIFFY